LVLQYFLLRVLILYWRYISKLVLVLVLTTLFSSIVNNPAYKTRFSRLYIVHIITGRRDNVSEMRPFIFELYNIATNIEDRSCGMRQAAGSIRR